MKIKCVKNNLEIADPFIINSDMRDYLEVGVEHIVYGLRITNKCIYYIIFNKDHLVEVPNKMFRIIDSSIGHLNYRIQNNGDITLFPELFYKDDFFDKFSDWEQEERSEFNKIKDLFEY